MVALVASCKSYHDRCGRSGSGILKATRVNLPGVFSMRHMLGLQTEAVIDMYGVEELWLFMSIMFSQLPLDKP
jgi:hypothetical protein